VLRNVENGSGPGHLVLSSSTEGNPARASVISYFDSPHIVGSSFAFSGGGNIFGSHLIINPGVIRNTNSADASGGNLYLRGGRGEQTNGTLSLATSPYGSTILGWDIDNNVQAGQTLIGTNTTSSGTGPLAPMVVVDKTASRQGVYSKGGYQYALTGTISIAANSTGTVTHSLGYIPIVQFIPGAFGTINAFLSGVSTSTFSIYNNSSTGITCTYWLW
jgi:hypothetical protein